MNVALMCLTSVLCTGCASGMIWMHDEPTFLADGRWVRGILVTLSPILPIGCDEIVQIAEELGRKRGWRSLILEAIVCVAAGSVRPIARRGCEARDVNLSPIVIDRKVNVSAIRQCAFYSYEINCSTLPMAVVSPSG